MERLLLLRGLYFRTGPFTLLEHSMGVKGGASLLYYQV